MPPWGWLMMGLGIFFTLVIGGGLMILIFYSSRAGDDEAPQIEYDEAPDSDFASDTTSKTVVPMRSRHKSDKVATSRTAKSRASARR
jgi:hypothetical protein